MLRKCFLILSGAILIASCGVSQYTARTQATINKDGSMTWDSSKNQENLKASFTRKDGNVEAFTIETTATTPEAAIAAAVQANNELTKQLTTLIQMIAPLIPAAAKAGAMAGS